VEAKFISGNGRGNYRGTEGGLAYLVGPLFLAKVTKLLDKGTEKISRGRGRPNEMKRRGG